MPEPTIRAVTTDSNGRLVALTTKVDEVKQQLLAIQQRLSDLQMQILQMQQSLG